jgi:flagellar basal body-associated protein FliL
MKVAGNTQKTALRLLVLIVLGVLALGVGVIIGSRNYQLQNSLPKSSSAPSYNQSNTESPK